MYAVLERNERRPLERVLGGAAFGVDPAACAGMAQVLAQTRATQPLFVLHRSKETELLLRLALAAICHQINWDFLSERLASAFDTAGLDAQRLALITARDVGRWLSGYHRPERIRAQERAALLRDLGSRLIESVDGHPLALLEGAGTHLQGSDGFLTRLDRFLAFREDPLRKKSNVLVHDLVRDGISLFKDKDTISPAIDYHIMRLYLRNGRVFPLHNETFELFRKDSSPRARLVRLLRESVSEALSLTAFYAGLSIPDVNGLEWQIGRDICDRLQPKCQSTETFGELANGSALCIYAGFCRAFADPDWRSLKEPDLKRSFY